MSISLRTLYIAAASHHTVQLTDTNHEYYPCVDSTELQRLFDTKLLDYPTFQKYPVGEVFRKLETHLRSDMYLAALGWRKRHPHDLVFAWSERGIPVRLEVAGWEVCRSCFRKQAVIWL